MIRIAENDPHPGSLFRSRKKSQALAAKYLDPDPRDRYHPWNEHRPQQAGHDDHILSLDGSRVRVSLQELKLALRLEKEYAASE